MNLLRREILHSNRAPRPWVISSFPFIVSSQSQDKVEQAEKGGIIGEEKQKLLIGGSKEAWHCSRSSPPFAALIGVKGYSRQQIKRCENHGLQRRSAGKINT